MFDFDSTLMDGETIDFLAQKAGVGDEVSQITKEAMEGKIDFFEALTRRVGLLKGLHVKHAKEVCHNLPYMSGAKKTIYELKKLNVKTVVFSGGFRMATSFAKEKLDFDGEFANILHVKNDVLSGEVGGEMMFSNSKGEMLRRIQTLLNISQEETLSVGDGANDISMFEHSGLKVAFCAKEALKKHADVTIDTKDLTKILKYIRM